MSLYAFYYKTEIGMVCIAEEDGKITNLIFPDDEFFSREFILEETPLLKEASRQLFEYFEGKRKAFDLPLSPKGTAFMTKVWDALKDIPYGETVSYKYIAEKIGNPKACRAVGMANNRNPISIIVPCHRVIGTNGKLVGYGGGLQTKSFLLNLEEAYYSPL